MAINPTNAVRRGSPEFRHNGFVSGGQRSSAKSRAAIDAIRLLATTFDMSHSEVQAELRQLSVTNTPLQQDTCTSSAACTDSKYRTLDGSCNNLAHSDWGKAGQPYVRMATNSYTDGLSTVRTSQAGSALPSPRILTQKVFVPGSGQPSEDHTMNLMTWGQFLAHDLVLTPGIHADDGSSISCCAADGTHLDGSDLHSECLPITIPSDDAWFAGLGRTCMGFVRSAFSADCDTGARAQLNAITTYIDANNVYGSSDAAANELRSLSDGKLKVQEKSGDNLLPGDSNAPGCPAPVGTAEPVCFAGGDVRVNEQPELAIMHTIWMRQHNKLAEQLKNQHPSWNDENLYQEARRIVGAQMQHIMYHEVLPIILGERIVQEYDLNVITSG